MDFDKEIIKGSIVLLIVFNLYSLLNLIFQSLMARHLSVAEYGVLAALGYFIYFSGMFSDSIQTVVARYSASEKDKGKVKDLILRVFLIALSIAGIFTVLYMIIMYISFRKTIPYGLAALNGAAIFIFLIVPVMRGTLQGKKRFFALGLDLFLEAIIKIALGIGLVLIGWKVYGAIAGIAVSLLVAFLFSVFLLRDVFKAKRSPFGIKNLFHYSLPFFIVMFAIFSFYSVDLILAQILFPKNVAGEYSIISILSKIIFWGTQPISRAMFPIVIERSSKKIRKDSAYANAFALVSLGIVLALLAFYFFPNLIITVFSGKTLHLSTFLLFLLGLSMAALSYAHLNLLHDLSVKSVSLKASLLFIFLLIAGTALMCYFSKNLLQFSLAFLVASLGFLVASTLLTYKK